MCFVQIVDVREKSGHELGFFISSVSRCALCKSLMSGRGIGFFLSSARRAALCKSLMSGRWLGFFIFLVSANVPCANHCVSERSPAFGLGFFISSARRAALCKSLVSESSSASGWAFLFFSCPLMCLVQIGVPERSPAFGLGFFIFLVPADVPCANRCVGDCMQIALAESRPIVSWAFFFFLKCPEMVLRKERNGER